MPNWVENKVTFIDGCDRLLEKLHELDNHIADKRPRLLSSFVPRPDIYEKYDTTNYTDKTVEVGKEYYLMYDEDGNKKKVLVTPEILADLKATINKQKEEYGAVGWYDWNCKYWGTKWDVFDWGLFHDSLSLSTAWSHPMEFFITLSKQYPEAVFAVEYVDEDLGSNCGCIFYKNGEYDELDPCFMYAVKVYDMDMFSVYEQFVRDNLEEDKE